MKVINKKGEIVIEPEFDYISEFSDGLAVISEDDKEGYINKKGDVVIEPEYRSAYGFADGIALVYDEDYLPFYINKKGSEVLDNIYVYVSAFTDDGYAVVVPGEDNPYRKYTIIDKSGKQIVGLYDGIYHESYDFSPGE